MVRMKIWSRSRMENESTIFKNQCCEWTLKFSTFCPPIPRLIPKRNFNLKNRKWKMNTDDVNKLNFPFTGWSQGNPITISVEKWQIKREKSCREEKNWNRGSTTLESWILAGLSWQTARLGHLSRPVSSGKCESLRRSLRKFLASIQGRARYEESEDGVGSC